MLDLFVLYPCSYDAKLSQAHGTNRVRSSTCQTRRHHVSRELGAGLHWSQDIISVDWWLSGPPHASHVSREFNAQRHSGHDLRRDPSHRYLQVERVGGLREVNYTTLPVSEKAGERHALTVMQPPSCKNMVPDHIALEKR